MTVTPTQFRRNLYRLLDQVLDTGHALEISRRGRTLRLVPDHQLTSVLDRVQGNRDAVTGDPDDLVEMDWSQCWVGAVEPE